ncbi:hypothetical protein EHP00_2488 [Ecytonucleospora hepatopenaei]|uniref:Uncharacterized protein n=1 Tax=Ecytonucleospora hepatopenaei TaxID=646526 RepID=A0A1W0E2J1_9MICR|nr:hypothetical protein EHP00_2488 [Ecytonucleospora hepatopenaei]
MPFNMCKTVFTKVMQSIKHNLSKIDIYITDIEIEEIFDNSILDNNTNNSNSILYDNNNNNNNSMLDDNNNNSILDDNNNIFI